MWNGSTSSTVTVAVRPEVTLRTLTHTRFALGVLAARFLRRPNRPASAPPPQRTLADDRASALEQPLGGNLPPEAQARRWTLRVRDQRQPGGRRLSRGSASGHCPPALVIIVPTVQRLYHREGAGRPPRVRWALEEAGAPYDFIVNGLGGGPREEHARRHPLVRVPVLETEEGTLFESAALCLHIADLHPEAELIPALGSHERATIYSVDVLRDDRARAGDDPRDPGAPRLRRRRDRKKPRPGWRRRAARLRTSSTRVRTSRATASRSPTSSSAEYFDSARHYDVMPDSPTLRAYLERLDARPAKRRAYDFAAA